MKTSDPNLLLQPQAILLMGPPGGGKTTFMLQWPNLWVADCDRNLAGPMRYLQSIGRYKPFKYDVIPVNDDGTQVPLNLAWQRLRTLTKAALADSTVQVVGLDTLTYCDQALYAHTCRVQGLSDLEGFHWSPYKRELHAFLSECRASGKTVIVACHEKIEYDKKGNVEKYIPSISTGISNYFGYYFTDIWRCTLEDQGGKVGLRSKLVTHPTAVSDLKNSLLFGKGDLEATYEAVRPFIEGPKT